METQKITLDTRIIKYDKNKNILDDYIVGKKVEHIENTIDIEINNGDGSIDRKIKMPFNSFVQEFLTTLRRRFLDTYIVSSDDKTICFYESTTPNSLLLGIVVGSGTGNFVVGATGLSAIIPNTTLTYYITTLNISNTGTITTLCISRIIKNDTATTINIKEVGLYAGTKAHDVQSATSSYLIARDINDSSGVPINIDLLAGQNMNIKYNISVNANDGLLYNFLNMFKVLSPFNGTASYNMTTIDGTSTAITYGYYETPKCFIMKDNLTYYGVVPGSGTTPVTAMDYKLDNIHLESPTGLTFGNSNLVSPITVSGNTTSFMIRKTFVNNSTANITINEAGIYTQGKDGAKRICIARILTGALVLPPGQATEISFNLKTTL